MTTSTDHQVDNETEVTEDLENGHLLEPPEYNLQVSRDRVYVLLDCPDPHNGLKGWAERILADFKLLEIPEFPDEEQIAQILRASCAPGEHLHEKPIMMGAEPVPTQHGRLEWSHDYFAEGWAENEDTGAVNYWEKLERGGVEEGELLVRLHNPVDGIPGLNVYGTEIPVAKAEKVKLRAGKHVQAEEDETGITYTATCNGRIRFVDGMVSVDDVYVIKGDVNLDTGNIHHTGAVMIQGDVITGATIEADGDVMVKGMLEPCHIKCGGDLTVAGGIVSEEGFQIAVQGGITARYITEANIQVGGNVLVTNEVTHSRILCRGMIKVPKGRIAGGMAVALKGIRVGEAGSSAASDTRLIAGVDHTLGERVQKHEDQIRKLETAQEKIQVALNTSLKKSNLTEEELNTVSRLKQQNAQITQALADSQANIQKLKADAAMAGRQEVVILKELWSGTTIQLGNAKTLVKRSILKPRLAEKRRNQVKILPLGEGNMPDEE